MFNRLQKKIEITEYGILSRFSFPVFRLFTQTQRIFKAAVTRAVARFYAKLRAYNNAPRAIHNQGDSAPHRVKVSTRVATRGTHANGCITCNGRLAPSVFHPPSIYDLARYRIAIGFERDEFILMSRSDRRVTQARYGSLDMKYIRILPLTYEF